MALLPTINPVVMEQTIVAAIRDRLLEVPLIAQMVKVELRERFADSDEDDVLISTVPDPAQPDLRMTSLIQIGMPSVSETQYTSEEYTQLTFSYPITFDMSAKDEWDNSDNALEYTNSRALFMAIYMLARAKFKESKILANFENCEHMYLQQDSAASVEDEETGKKLHVADWSLVVHVKGVNT